jgi:succinate-acetate transporter protein
LIQRSFAKETMMLDLLFLLLTVLFFVLGVGYVRFCERI